MKLSGKKIIFPFYHFVEEHNEENKLISNLYKAKNCSEFKKDLDFLTKNFEPISIDDFINKKNIKNKFSFLLSFDDGLSNFYKVVSPILEEENIPAINFINSEFVDNKDLFYRYKINILIDVLKRKELTKNQQNIICEKLKIENFNFQNILDSLKKIKYLDTHLINELCEILNIDMHQFLLENKPYLSKKQILKLTKKGFYFGAHSKSHPHFLDIDYENQILETLESVNYLRNEFKYKNVTFAFPFSDDNVSLRFFNFFKEQNLLTFGTAGIKDELEDINNIQRIPMEYKFSKYSAETIIKGELILYILKKIVGKNYIKRS
ncbi:MAG: polysaccharide deacetylase family protein [Polaribacter sp.]